MKEINPKRLLLVGLLALAAAAITSGPASAATVTVCPSGCSFSQIAPAIAAVSPGDMIKVAAGHYDGGFTIDKSLKLAGAGAGSTIISGGGPVITVGTAFADSEPTVSISGVTITGGVSNSSFLAQFIGDAIAVGGGISVPPAANFGQGATVSIASSVITGNRAEPLTVLDSGSQCPPDITITCINGDLPFAQAGGGGINTFGPMTLTNTTVSDNQSGGNGVASEAGPGGIFSFQGGLTLKDSTIRGNRAIASAPNGLTAEAGGVAVKFDALTIVGSRISGNSAVLDTAMPNDIQEGTAAHGGGIQIEGNDNCSTPDSGCAVATITSSTITDNSVIATNSVGDATGFCGGICDDGQLVLRDSLVGNNHVTATVPAGSTTCACADSAGIGTGGIETISDSHIAGNTVTASAPDGHASASAGGGSDGNGVSNTITDSLITGNQITATTTTGTASVQGGGFVNYGAVMVMRDTTISDNSGTATGANGTARGGGIWNGSGGTLTLIDSAITHNALTSSTAAEGGGLFTTLPVTLKNTVIALNSPDQCFGC